MGLFGAGKKREALPTPAREAPASSTPPSSSSPRLAQTDAIRVTLTLLSSAASADEASRVRAAAEVLGLVSQLAQQLSEVGSALHEATLTVVRQTSGVEALSTVLADACRPGARMAAEESLGLQQATLSSLASVAYLGGVSDLQQRGDLPLLVQLMGAQEETVRSFAAACMQNVTSLVDQLDLVLFEAVLPALRALTEHADESVAGPARMVLDNLEHARRVRDGEEALEAGGVTSTPRTAVATTGSAWWKPSAAASAAAAFRDAGRSSSRPPADGAAPGGVAPGGVGPADDGSGQTVERLVELTLRCGAGGFGLVLVTGAAGRVFVESVDAEGPNAAAGVRAEDELVAVGGAAVRANYDAAVESLRAASAAATAAREAASAPTLHLSALKAAKLADALGGERAAAAKLYVRAALAEAGAAEVGAGGGVSARTDVLADAGKGAWDARLALPLPPGCAPPALVQLSLLDRDDARGEAAPLAAAEVRLGAAAKGKEKLSLPLAAPADGQKAEVRLAFSWALETPRPAAELGEESLPCVVARRVAAPSPWNALGGMLAQLDVQLLRMVDPYQAVRMATAATTITRAARAWLGRARGAIAARQLTRTREEELAAAQAAQAAASAVRTQSTLRAAVDATSMAHRLAAAGIHSATPINGRQLQMRRADFERLASSGGLPALLAPAAPSTPATLAGRYYAQRYDDDAYARAGPSLSALADANEVRKRMQVAPITDGDRSKGVSFRAFAEHSLARKVRIVKDGTPIQLTGKQVEALSIAAARNPARPIAFDHSGTRVVLTSAQIASLREAVEAETLPEERREWFFSADGTSKTQHGPVGASELQRRYAAGELTDAAVAWNPRLAAWTSLGELPEMQCMHPRNTVGRRAHRVDPMPPEHVDLNTGSRP